MTKTTTTVGGGEATNKAPAATRRVRVDQEIIDVMLKQAARLPPSRAFPEFPESIDRLCPGSRDKLARVAAMLRKSDDRDAGILRQYRAKGYAEIELLPEELDSDDDEVLVTEEEEEGNGGIAVEEEVDGSEVFNAGS